MEKSLSCSGKYSLRHRSTPLKKYLKFDDEFCRKSKRRKKTHNRKEKMKDILINIEKEIEEQLDTKTDDNDFTTTNVKGILKELILDEDMKEMVRQTLHPGGSIEDYEPKLTRAKLRKLLELRPDLAVPTLWSIPQTNTNFVSECLSLINEDYSENSEDEEYKPDEDDKSEYADSLFQSECDMLESEQTLNSSLNYNENPISTDIDDQVLEIEENIGQRTRSKLPLTETRLEDIEQTFNPPDITSDMYETEIDNEDYINFLIECTTSYEHTDVDDDQDDDPEFVIPADAETIDAEELRSDKTTEVTPKELEHLLAELEIDYARIKALIDNKKLFETVYPNHVPATNDEVKSNKKIELEKDHQLELSESLTKTCELELPILSEPQKLLLQQQLRQHVQLITLHFLQCYKHVTLFKYANEFKNILVSLKLLTNSKKDSIFYVSNLDDALKLITEWEKLCAHFPEPKNNFIILKKHVKKKLEFPPELMKMVCKSRVVLYPLLLPEVPFSYHIINNHKKTITRSEEWLVAVGLEQFYEYIQNRSKLNCTKPALWETLKLINHYLLPNFSPTYLQRLIKKKNLENTENSIKYYLEKKKAPPLKHFIVPVSSKPLFSQPLDLLPEVWKNYIQDNFVIIY
ncbi:hypothetical protein PGB90_000736 [Kerria lacca]